MTYVAPEPGTAARAFAAWRATASAMLPIWWAVPFLATSVVKGDDGWQDLAFVILAVLGYCVGVLVIIPLFAFTVGRWLDRRSAPRGLRSSVITFGLYGAAFGLVLVLLLGLSGLTLAGVLVLLLAPTLTAIAGRLLVELKQRVWYTVIWGTFALSVVVALALVATTFVLRQG